MTDETAASPAEALAATMAPRLALLRAVAAEGNLTRAAALLDVPQPTASRWLATMAEQVGAPVVIRDGRGIRLSRVGQYLAEAATGAMTVLERGARQVVEDTDPDRGHVVLAFLHTMGEARVPALLRAFRQRHPKVRFTLLQGAQEEMLARLRSGEADLALTSPLPSEPDLVRHKIADQPLVVTVPVGHRLAGRKRIKLAELAGETFVGLKAGYGLRRITDELCQAAGFLPELAFEGAECDTVRGLVAAELGVAVLPVAETALPGGVVELPLSPVATRQIGLVWAGDRPLAPAARAFQSFVLSAP